MTCKKWGNQFQEGEVKFALLLIKISQQKIKPSPRIIWLDINEALFQLPGFSHSLFKH